MLTGMFFAKKGEAFRTEDFYSAFATLDLTAGIIG